MFARDIAHSQRIQKARQDLERAQSAYDEAKDHAFVQPTAGQFNAIDDAAKAHTTHLSSRETDDGQRTLTDC